MLRADATRLSLGEIANTNQPILFLSDFLQVMGEYVRRIISGNYFPRGELDSALFLVLIKEYLPVREMIQE
jgi:hypothetical protein